MNTYKANAHNFCIKFTSTTLTVNRSLKTSLPLQRNGERRGGGKWMVMVIPPHYLCSSRTNQ